jgi:hypothetical protein
MGGFVVLQISMDSLKGESGSHNETCLTSAGEAHAGLNIKVEEDTDTEEEVIPMPVFCAIKVEQDEVSYMFLYPLLFTFHHYKEIASLFVIFISLSTRANKRKSGEQEYVSLPPPTHMKGTLVRGLCVSKCREE